MDVEELRHLYVTQVLPWQPRVAPVGAIVVHDSSLIRMHCGTHGTVVHADVDDTSDLNALVARQTAAFIGRAEPAEWTLLESSAPPHLAESLAVAGWTRGWVRTVVIGEASSIGVESALPRGASIEHDRRDVEGFAERGGPFVRPLGRLLLDGRHQGFQLHTTALCIDGALRLLGGSTCSTTRISP